jgi:Na+-driven multidrug efflux pump
VAALGVGHKLEVLNYFVCAGMGAAATTLVGQNLGAGESGRAVRSAWRALFLTCLPVGVITVLLVTFPEIAIGVFSSDADVVAAGVTYVLLVGMTQLFMAAEVVLLGAFAGAQWTAWPAAIVIVLTAVRVPLSMLLVAQGWGVEAVWFAIASTTVVKGLLLAGLFGLRYGRGEKRLNVKSSTFERYPPDQPSNGDGCV